MGMIEDFEERKRQVEKDIITLQMAPDFTQSVRDRLRAAVDAYGELIASLKRRGEATGPRHPPGASIK